MAIVLLSPAQIDAQVTQTLKTIPTILLEPDEVEACLCRALQHYLSYAGSVTHRPDPFDLDTVRSQPLDMGEWVEIRKLFVAYVEQANALLLESTQPTGVPTYGRSSSEISSQISELETTMQSKAFSQGIVILDFDYLA